MAQRTPERKEILMCQNCSHSYYYSPNKATTFHAEKSHQATWEKLENERKTYTKKIKQLEEKVTELQEKLASKESQLTKLYQEKDAERKQLADWKKQFEAHTRETDSYSNQQCTNIMCIRERARYLLVKDEADIRVMEEACKQKAATREDVQEICDKLLSTQYSSYKEDQDKLQRNLLVTFQTHLKNQEARSKEEMDKMRQQFKKRQCNLKECIEKLEDEKAALEEKLKHNLRKTRCQEDAEVCKGFCTECCKLKGALSSAESKEVQMTETIAHLQWKLKQQDACIAQLNAADCQRPTCAIMAQKITKLEYELEKKTIKLNKRATYHEVNLEEDLNIEYEKLLSSYEVLKVVEDHFKEHFDAKGFLSDIFMDAYEKCKECLMENVCRNIGELFKLQTEEHRIDKLEGVSHAFGLLLQTSGIKTLVTASEAVPHVQKKVEENIPQLRRSKKTTHNAKGLAQLLPLKRFVQLAWKFVTQAYPIIVREPVMSQLNHEMHRESFDHWDEARDGDRPLIYAQPVVYRSYHGEVLIKGLVGNI